MDTRNDPMLIITDANARPGCVNVVNADTGDKMQVSNSHDSIQDALDIMRGPNPR